MFRNLDTVVSRAISSRRLPPYPNTLRQTHKFVHIIMNYHAHHLTLDHFVGIRKPSALEEAEGPQPEPKERTRTVLELTEGLGPTV